MEVLLKNHPKLETTQNPLNWAIDRQIVGILVSTKKKEFLIHSTTRTNLICMVRPERIQPHNTTNSVIQFIWRSGRSKTVGTENRSVVAGDGGWRKRNAAYLDCAAYVTVGICQNSQTAYWKGCILWYLNYILRKKIFKPAALTSGLNSSCPGVPELLQAGSSGHQGSSKPSKHSWGAPGWPLAGLPLALRFSVISRALTAGGGSRFWEIPLTNVITFISKTVSNCFCVDQPTHQLGLGALQGEILHQLTHWTAVCCRSEGKDVHGLVRLLSRRPGLHGASHPSPWYCTSLEARAQTSYFIRSCLEIIRSPRHPVFTVAHLQQPRHGSDLNVHRQRSE